mmetsp:Transcript_11762/g.35277  ORF Transcript_11762/g.35277 Transcript_11762/m.35277 type:complete len:113 (-) Transcript_11762:475-813(-)
MAMSMTQSRVSAFINARPQPQQLRTQRPARMSVLRKAAGTGERQADQKAEEDIEQMAAPEGDRVLAGEKVQRGGTGASGEGGAKGADKTTPSGQESKRGVANDKDEAAKGTH